MEFKTSNHKPNLRSFDAPLPEHVTPPNPMTPEELEAPAPTPVQLKETLRRVLAHVVTPAKLQHLIFKMYDCARNGDKWAAQLLFDLIRGAKEADPGTPEDSSKPMSRKQVEEELAKLGFVKPQDGITVKPSQSDTV